MSREIATVTRISPPDGEWTDEPTFPRPEHTQLYNTLVERMEAEASVLPGMGTAVGLMIRTLARDYVVRVIADQGDTEYQAMAVRAEKDRRMLSLFKMLLEQASRADLEHALRTEFVLGLVTEVMRVLDGEVDDSVLRIRLKELMSEAFVTYTDSVKGRIGR